MTHSLNELEALAKRATRGAGYSWGQAEEASKATRWLCVQGLDGVGELSRLLQLGLASTAYRPFGVEGPWRGEKGLCPLSAGPLLSDCAHLLQAETISMKDVHIPALLLPFAANAARALGKAVSLTIGDMQVVTDGRDLTAPDGVPELAHNIMVAQDGTLDTTRTHQTRARPRLQDLEVLNRYAHRTYAPATEESRRLGAGAGLSDND